MPRLTAANIVLAFVTRNAKTTSLDLLARVSVLGGIAGVKPGTWMKDTIPKHEIVEVFGPDVKATWLSPRDSGLVAAVRRSLEPLLRKTTTTADDILQPAIIGLGAPGERSRMPLFYGVGKAPGFTVAKVKAGTLGARDVLPVARAYARRRAIDVLRAQARRPPVVRVDGDEVEPVGNTDVLDSIVGVIMDPAHRMHEVLHRALWSVIETKARPSDRRIFEALFRGAKAGLNDATVARELGLSRAAVSQAKKRIGIIARDAIAVTIDVLGESGDLIVVGGPAKARSPGALGDRLRVLRTAAEERRVTALAFFEGGTPQSVLDIAARQLGASNVRVFPR